MTPADPMPDPPRTRGPEAETPRSAAQALFAVVRRIPSGRVASYGAVGAVSERPVSGYLAGRWLGMCPPDLPWWRVVGKDGDLLIAKRSPVLAQTQRQHLEDEGVAFTEDGRVRPEAFLHRDDLS